MKRLNFWLFVLTTLSLTGSLTAQTRCRSTRVKGVSTSKVKLTSMTVAPVPPANSSPTTGGISFHAITSDNNGGVWIGGNVLEEGLLININQGRIKTITLPSIRNVQNIFFTTEKTGWLLTQGEIHTTKNGGLKWKKVDLGQPAIFKTLYFSDVDNGWVIGDSGIIYHTSDGGQSWNKQNSGTEFDLTQIYFINPLHGWLVGINPREGYRARAFFYTTDGGMTWQSAPVEESAPVEVVGFVDENRGWAIDVDNNITNTVDGGETWNVLRPGKQDAWENIHFVNHLEGWVAGDGIIHTKDGGITWKYQVFPANRDGGKFLDKIYFTDTKHGWALGFFRVLQTNDGGNTWEAIPDEWKERVITKVLNDISKNSKEIVENN